MKYKALVSFSGLVSMAKDEVMDISDSSFAKDLLKAGYIMKIDKPKTTKKKKGEKS